MSRIKDRYEVIKVCNDEGPEFTMSADYMKPYTVCPSGKGIAGMAECENHTSRTSVISFGRAEHCGRRRNGRCIG